MSDDDEKKYVPNLEATYAGLEIGFVIEKTNSIEGKLKKIISSYLAISDKGKAEFFMNILMNNALVNLSSKVKAFIHISKLENWPEVKNKDFQTIMSIRNAFAHNNIAPVNTINISINLDEDDVVPDIQIGEFILLESVSGSGTLTKVNIKKALEDFTQSYKRINDTLLEIMILQTDA